MSNVAGKASVDENLRRELYFLIIKFLSEGPCTSAAEVLKREVESLQLLPKGINWFGETTPQNFVDTAVSNPHIPGDFLQKICERLLPLLEQTIPPSVKGVSSLLGAGRQSLLRPAQDPGHVLTSNHLTVCRHGAPIAPGFKTRNTFNLTNVVNARQASGTFCKRNFLQHGLFFKMSM
ncbi:Hypothetical predicted protein, partial [Paramuricea clavata]